MSTKHIEGNIADLYPESLVSKAGKNFTVWVGELDTGDMIDFGFNRPSVTIGEHYHSACEYKFGKWKPIEGGGKAPARPSAAASVAAKPQFPIEPLSRENAIIRQNSLTNAVNSMANVALEDQFDLTQPEGRADYAEAVIDLAYRFHEFSSGQRESKAAAHVVMND